MDPVRNRPTSDLAASLSLLLEQISRSSLRSRLYSEEGSGESAGRCAPREADAHSLVSTLSARRVRGRQRALTEAGIGAIGLGEEAFPGLLAGIPDPPLLLYHRGALECLAGTAVAIVGGRRASQAGQDLARSLAAELAGAGAVIVSGLALGVDAAAHRGALEAGGRTIAILGSGVDRLTPLANSPLGEQILTGGGLILSEYPPGTPAAPYRFPERNRLISGLSRGVVVVEANERSGSLITARLAAEQGREVMAVPGIPGYLNSTGSNRLLKAGAALIERAEDVLHAIGAEHIGGRVAASDHLGRLEQLSAEQQRLLDLLDGRAQHLEVLAAALGCAEQACAVSLTELELAGFVQRVGGGYIRRPSEF